MMSDCLNKEDRQNFTLGVYGLFQDYFNFTSIERAAQKTVILLLEKTQAEIETFDIVHMVCCS